MIYLLGSWPTMNNVLGVPLCRIVEAKLPLALVVLMLGNINTVLANTALLELSLWLWHQHPFLLIFTVILLVAVVWRRRQADHS